VTLQWTLQREGPARRQRVRGKHRASQDEVQLPPRPTGTSDREGGRVPAVRRGVVPATADLRLGVYQVMDGSAGRFPRYLEQTKQTDRGGLCTNGWKFFCIEIALR